MSFASLVRNMTAVANRITKPLQVPVIHKAWIAQTPYGEETFAAASLGSDGLTLKGVVELKQQLKTLPNGQAAMTKAVVTFTEPVPANGTAGRTEPIDTRDYIELPGGITGPILNVEAVLNPETGRGYITEVWLGV